MRIRITFAKTDAMRYTGHLDLQRTLERTFRRAGLPLAFSQGFNPRPRLNLASALPLGFTSESELVEVWLDSSLPVSSLQTDLVAAAPPGIEISRVERVDDKVPKLPNLILAAEYKVTLLHPLEDLNNRLEDLLAEREIPRERRGKPYDLRPLVEALECHPDDASGRQQIVMRLTARPGATGRPDEVLLTLGIPPEAARVHRTRLILAESEASGA